MFVASTAPGLQMPSSLPKMSFLTPMSSNTASITRSASARCLHLESWSSARSAGSRALRPRQLAALHGAVEILGDRARRPRSSAVLRRARPASPAAPPAAAAVAMPEPIVPPPMTPISVDLRGVALRPPGCSAPPARRRRRGSARRAAGLSMQSHEQLPLDLQPLVQRQMAAAIAFDALQRRERGAGCVVFSRSRVRRQRGIVGSRPADLVGAPRRQRARPGPPAAAASATSRGSPSHDRSTMPSSSASCAGDLAARQ